MVRTLTFCSERLATSPSRNPNDIATVVTKSTSTPVSPSESHLEIPATVGPASTLNSILRISSSLLRIRFNEPRRDRRHYVFGSILWSVLDVDDGQGA